MTATLASCTAFAPWRSEAATTAGAFLADADPLDVIRSEPGARLPREVPRPAIDDRIRRSRSIASPQPPATWEQIGAYAETAVRTALTWAAADGGSGPAWSHGYSGPVGLVDHLVLALLRNRGVVREWTAHVTDLPTHLPTGERRTERVTEGALSDAVVRILGATPHSLLVADWVPALLGQADRVVAGSPELAAVLAGLPGLTGDRVEVWQRPPVVASAPDPRPAAARGSGPVRICGRVDAGRLRPLEPVLQALGHLPAAQRDRLRLTLATNDAVELGTRLRAHDLEDVVHVIRDDSCVPVAPGDGVDVALVLDAPTPAGFASSPAGLPELTDWQALGIPVILLAPQDSPFTTADVTHHLPADHASAARALLSRLADG